MADTWGVEVPVLDGDTAKLHSIRITGDVAKPVRACRDVEIMQVGSPVTIGGKIKATITAVCIREHRHVTYECVWWDGNTRNCQWLEQIEILRRNETQSINIGFRSEVQ